MSKGRVGVLAPHLPHEGPQGPAEKESPMCIFQCTMYILRLAVCMVLYDTVPLCLYLCTVPGLLLSVTWASGDEVQHTTLFCCHVPLGEAARFLHPPLPPFSLPRVTGQGRGGGDGLGGAGASRREGVN